ncbi:MAG: hypothetical protein CMH83_19390 [Nocardioides sp.]|nr:hypothetical protein [Nocardioides sp.]
MSRELRVNGLPLSGIAAWGALEWETRLPGGLWSVSWEMDLPVGFFHPALVTGATVELYDAGWRIGGATLAEPDLAEGAFTADGHCRLAETVSCLDGSGNRSTVPDTAVDAAIARGALPGWSRTVSFGASTLTDDTTATEPAYLSTLLDGWSDTLGQQWALDHLGDLVLLDDPATPDWHLTPSGQEVGLTDEDYYTLLHGRYINTSGTYVTVSVGSPGREGTIDLTGLGRITLARASAILGGQLAKSKGRVSFTGSVEVTPETLQTAGGISADLTTVRAGQRVRMHNPLDPSGLLDGATYFDWTIGQTAHADGSGVATIAPVGLAPRDLTSVSAAS